MIIRRFISKSANQQTDDDQNAEQQRPHVSAFGQTMTLIRSTYVKENVFNPAEVAACAVFIGFQPLQLTFGMLFTIATTPGNDEE